MTINEALTSAAAQFDAATLPALRKLETLLLEAGIDEDAVAREVLGWRVSLAQARQNLLERVSELAR